MAAIDIILNAGQIVLSQSTSWTGIVLDDSPLLFGSVEVINDLTDRFEVGNNVLFDPTNATKFSYSGIEYFLTTEDKVFFQEPFAP